MIVSLLLVPALTRVGQALDPGCHPVAGFSFSKSSDVPPDLISVAPDLAVTPLDAAALVQRVHGHVVSDDDAVPPPPDVLDTGALRGPPDSSVS
jgi:hypothetical protein